MTEWLTLTCQQIGNYRELFLYLLFLNCVWFKIILVPSGIFWSGMICYPSFVSKIFIYFFLRSVYFKKKIAVFPLPFISQGFQVFLFTTSFQQFDFAVPWHGLLWVFFFRFCWCSSKYNLFFQMFSWCLSSLLFLTLQLHVFGKLDIVP